jgi:hypothetical protein
MGFDETAVSTLCLGLCQCRMYQLTPCTLALMMSNNVETLNQKTLRAMCEIIIQGVGCHEDADECVIIT